MGSLVVFWGSQMLPDTIESQLRREEEFDRDLANFLNYLREDDLLLITADHGNDPTWSGTDHTREYVPIFAYNKNLKGGNLGLKTTFADLGQTVAENFKVESQSIGTSFLKDLK